MASSMLPADELASVHAGIANYYSGKVREHGTTAHGADWACKLTQELRFVQLLRLCDFDSAFTLNDLGCGYGALLGFLRKRHRKAAVDYLGIDLSEAMIDGAQRLFGRHRHCEFITGSSSPRIADYSVASGIFNVKLNQSTETWRLFIERTMAGMHASSRLGFAVNFLISTAPDSGSIPELYRASPAVWAAYCEKEFDSRVEVLDRYGMHEFTLLVRRRPAAPLAG